MKSLFEAHWYSSTCNGAKQGVCGEFKEHSGLFKAYAGIYCANNEIQGNENIHPHHLYCDHHKPGYCSPVHTCANYYTCTT